MKLPYTSVPSQLPAYNNGTPVVRGVSALLFIVILNSLNIIAANNLYVLINNLV